MILKNGFVLLDSVLKRDLEIEGNKIAKIGKDLKGEDVIDCRGKLIMPGLVNTHTHVAMALFRGFADDKPLKEWLENHIWPQEAKLTSRDCYWGSMLGILEMIKGGVTCFSDMYFFMEETVKACNDTGVRGVLSHGMIDFGDREKREKEIKESLEILEMTKKYDRISYAFGPHTPYTCSEELLVKSKKLADENNCLLHIHVSEAEKEFKDFKKKEKTPVEFLDSLGILDEKTLMAHCVHLEERDISIISERKSSVSHCPVSNLKLASGIAPIPKMIEEGCNVTLGTDSAASNNSLNMFSDMKTMALLHKQKNPTLLPATQCLKIATENGGKALNLKIGKIEEGYLADLIVVDLKSPSFIPNHNIFSNLVYSQPKVERVIVDGRVVMENGELKTFSQEKILEEAQKQALDLVSR